MGAGMVCCYKNVLATYSHVHASGAKGWARALLEQAVYYQKKQYR